MAGIKRLEKRPEHLNYILNELLKPSVHQALFDDMMGMIEIGALLYDPLNIVYGIFEKGHPVPIGCVLLLNVRPYRGCQVHAAIFDPEKRNAKRMQGVAQAVARDMIYLQNLHYVETRTVAGNDMAQHLIEKLGFKKVGTKPGNAIVNGKYVDVDEYYAVLNGDKHLEIPEIPKV